MANPFLQTDFEIRWSQLTPGHIAPAIEQALTDAQAAIDVIAARELSNVTFENTFLALERSTERLNQAWGKVTHLQSVADSPELRDAHNAMLPKVSAFFARIPLNAALWERLRAFWNTHAADELNPVCSGVIWRRRSQISASRARILPVEKRARFEALQSELAQLTQKYSENVLDATNAWELDGRG
ncbi:MAG: hypothetical protein QM760_18365 [Nibricoccus sp.]